MILIIPFSGNAVAMGWRESSSKSAPISVRVWQRERDGERTDRALESLRRTAETDDNLLPRMLEAVRSFATVGEMSRALVPVFGTYREASVL